MRSIPALLVSITVPTMSALVFVGGCDDAEPTGTPQVECEGDYEVFEPGMEFRTEQGNFYIELVQADPDPPDEGDNDWVVRLTTESGSPVSGGTVVLEPWMPAHGHGISPPTYSGVEGTDGEYTIPTFDLIMPGVWEFELLVTESMMNDTARVSFCIQG